MSKKTKIPLTAEQLYKKNQKKSKRLKRLAPLVFWLFMVLAVLFLVLTVKYSLGNLVEIFSLLDKDKLTGEQVAENYAQLIEKWGEWTIVGEGGGLFSVQFIDIRAALFSGLMFTFLVLAIGCLALAVILGKMLLPRLSRLYEESNQDMVNLATLQTNTEIQNIKKKEKNEEWF